jgi:hypothetical protein
VSPRGFPVAACGENLMATHIQSFGPLIAVSAKVKTCIVSRENGDRNMCRLRESPGSGDA